MQWESRTRIRYDKIACVLTCKRTQSFAPLSALVADIGRFKLEKHTEIRRLLSKISGSSSYNNVHWSRKLHHDVATSYWRHLILHQVMTFPILLDWCRYQLKATAKPIGYVRVLILLSKKADLTVKLDRCEPFTSSIIYVGHLTQTRLLDIDSHYAADICDLNLPATVMETRFFTELCSVFIWSSAISSCCDANQRNLWNPQRKSYGQSSKIETAAPKTL